MTTSLIDRPRCRPSAPAASLWPTGTAKTPARTISAMNAAVKVTSPNTSAAISGMIWSPPLRLKPESRATSNVNGAPAAAITSAGSPRMSAAASERGRRLRACPLLSPPRPHAKSERKSDSHQRPRPETRRPSSRATGIGKIEAAVVEKDDAADADRLPRSRQGLENRVVPEQQQQQQRRVAHDAGVNERKSRQQPIGGEARHADHEAQQRRQRNADDGDEKGVEQPDPKGPSVGGQVGIAYQMEIDIKAGDIVPKSEAHRNAAGAHIDHSVVDCAPSQCRDDPSSNIW